MNKVSLVVICVVILAVAIAIGLIGRGFNTASEVADKTVFNSDKIINSYEDFHKLYQSYEQYKKQKSDAELERSRLESQGVTSGQRYDNLSLEIDGARNMMRSIASRYNSASQISYQAVWKEKGLPEKLE